MPAVPRRGPGTSRYTGPAVHPYCCFQAPVAALPAPFSYTHRPGRSGRHGPAGSGVDFPIPQNSFGCVLPKMGSRACRRAISRHGPGGECRMPEGGLPWTVYPGPPAQNRPPNPSTLHRPPKPVYPVPPAGAGLPARLPWTAHQDRPPNPSRLTLLYSTLNDVGLWISLPKPWLQAPFPFKARQNIAAVPNVQRKRPSY